jgi:hypothetical protein
VGAVGVGHGLEGAEAEGERHAAGGGDRRVDYVRVLVPLLPAAQRVAED